MKINIRLHFLSFFLFPLAFTSCNSSYVGRSNMDGNDHTSNKQNGGSSFNKSSGPSTQSSFESLHRFIDDFSKNVMHNVTNLIKLNANNNDLLSQAEKVICQLYDPLPTDHEKLYFTKAQRSQSDHIAQNQYLKDNFQQVYNDFRSSNDYKLDKKLHNLMSSLFSSIHRQVILEMDYVLNQTHKNQINQLGPDGYLSLCHQIVSQAKEPIKKIINLRFPDDKECSKNIEPILKRSMGQCGLLKSPEASDEDSTYKCLEDYFNRLKIRYYDAIEQKAAALLEAIQKNIRPLALNNPNLALLENSVHRLRHTICIYNGVRLLLHCYLIHNSMILARSSTEGLGTDYIKDCADKVIRSTYLTDVYIARMNLGREDNGLSTACSDLIQFCADMAKWSPNNHI